MLNRRGFLTALAGLAAGATLDPDRLLWIPGRKVISIPRVAKAPFLAVLPFLAVGDIVTFGKWPEVKRLKLRGSTSSANLTNPSARNLA